ncbi:hypothetical protein Tco_0475844 [Tanacetum coccineum]
MSTSNVHQQSLADAGSETRPPMLERGSYIPWASRFRRYLNQKRETRKWLNKAIDDGPYEFRVFTPSETEAPRMQKEEDLRGDDLKHYEAIEAMNLILISIPNDIYNSIDACTTSKAIWQRVECLMRGTMQNQKLEKSHDPLALVADTCSSSRISSPYYVTHPSSVVDYDDDYQGDTVQNNSDDPLTSAIFYNFGNNGRNTRRSYIQKEVIESNNVQNDAGNIQRTLRTASSGTIANMEEIMELSSNICLMARIQPANTNGSSNDSAFLSEVQTPYISYVNPLFAKDNQEQKYLTQPKIINKLIGDDQIDSNIIFDEPNEDVNSGSVENDNNVQDSYELEQLARNAYKEAEKQQ